MGKREKKSAKAAATDTVKVQVKKSKRLRVESDDEDEANEDLSLKIVQKALLRGCSTNIGESVIVTDLKGEGKNSKKDKKKYSCSAENGEAVIVINLEGKSRNNKKVKKNNKNKENDIETQEDTVNGMIVESVDDKTTNGDDDAAEQKNGRSTKNCKAVIVTDLKVEKVHSKKGKKKSSFSTKNGECEIVADLVGESRNSKIEKKKKTKKNKEKGIEAQEDPADGMREDLSLNVAEKASLHGCSIENHEAVIVTNLKGQSRNSKKEKKKNEEAIETQEDPADGVKNRSLHTKAVNVDDAAEKKNGCSTNSGSAVITTDLEGESMSSKKRKKKNDSSIKNDDVMIADLEGESRSIKKEKKKKKKNKEKDVETQGNYVDGIKEESMDTKATNDADDAAENVPVEMSDNVVLRRLLRGPRYFDPPGSSWGACYNCGEEGHSAVNCTSAKRKKPCFVCGSFDHNAKQCAKGQDCFICKKGGHRAKDCPEKSRGYESSKMCLKCGDSGHDMLSCRNNYSADDLKEIQCYICKSFGHLCCANYPDDGPSEISCYRCGILGHTGLACMGSHWETSGTGRFSSCYRCGEEGHFARECTNVVNKWNREFSTPKKKVYIERREQCEFRSAPQARHGGVYESGYKTKQKAGWIADDPGDFPQSPSTPGSKGGRVFIFGDASVSFSSRKSHRLDFTGPVKYHHHRFSASRFGNKSHDGRRIYEW